MVLKEIRNKYGITQKKAAFLIGVPYRTYVRYEEDESKQDKYKYKKMLEDLNNALRIDEEHGLLTIRTIRETLVPILEANNISFCYLFGSYARGDANEKSDVDLLVDTDITGIAFFKLVEEIRNSLNKKVDLIRLRDLKSENPIILEILKEGVRILWLVKKTKE